MLTNEITRRIEWADCDPAKIVFYPNYFAWFDDANWKLFAKAGFPPDVLYNEFKFAGMPIVEARHHFTRIAARQPDLSPIEARFAVKMFVLERFLDLEFRKADKGHLPAASTSSTPA